MSTSPSCKSPVSLRPVSPSILDQFHLNDESFDFGVATSPGSKRCPTFKDYADKIKQLQQENFQLRVRIYLSEQKTGIKTSSSDLAVLYSHLPQIQNGLPGSGNATNILGTSHSMVHSSPSTSSASAFESLNFELDKMKSEKDKLMETIDQLENKLHACEDTLISKQDEIEKIMKQNVELLKKNEDIVLELASANSAIQKLNSYDCSRNSGKVNDDEVERLACLAFGHNEDVELINSEWETKLAEKRKELKCLETELDHTRKKLDSADRKINGLMSEMGLYESERPRLEIKIMEMSESLKDMGQRLIRTNTENEKLRRKLLDKTSENVEKEKLSAIQQVVSLLQSKMKELSAFVETLLQLESKKVFTLTGLTNENRENLLKSIEHSRMFSDSLDKLLEKKDRFFENSVMSIKDFYVNGNDQVDHRCCLPPASSGQSSSMFTALDRHCRKSDGVQCNILDSSLLNSLESANSYINKLRNDIATLEKINTQLLHEKSDLSSQLKSLESSMNVLRMANHVDKCGNIELTSSKLKEENRKLTKRLTVTEDALRHLHTQHAKMVGELKTLRNTYQKSSVSIGGAIVDSTRPTDSNSPDLGIDSGHDGAVNSDDSHGNNYKEENRILRTTNRELALKLKQTRQALDITLEKLNCTTKEKEQVEKAICRQLHKTHTILRQAKRSVEKFTNSQCQENIMPNP